MVVCRFVKRYASKQDVVNDMATKGGKGIRQKKIMIVDSGVTIGKWSMLNRLSLN